MRLLVACEESQEVCKAFRGKGHEAYSCDIEPCSGWHPEWHIQVDVLELLKMKWDMIIAFPPCTYMTNAGAVRMRVKGEIVPERYEKAMQAKEFFMKFYHADCSKIAIENPTPMKIVGLPPYDQAIQPYQFGHPYSKRTCLWLKGLPPLFPTEIMAYHEPYVNGGCKDAHGNYRRFQGRRNVIPKQEVKPFQVSQKQWRSSGDSRTNERRAEMERLTEMYGGMIVPRKACTFDREGGADDCKECTEICEDEGGVCRTCVLQECLTRLWDYEDTGLTPPEITGKMEALRIYKEQGLTPEQIMELKARDTAKAPEVFDGHWYKCPRCGMYAGGLKGNFCHRCGQRLKWED